jgi:hypothetical protein
MLLVSLLLFMKVNMNKNEYYDMDTSLIFTIVMCMLISSAFVFNHYFLRYTIWLNVIITCIIFKLSVIITNKLMWLALRKIETLNAENLPLGWQYNYKWFEFLVVGLIMVVISELVFNIKKTIVQANNHK